jgi:hypothetical protein
VEKGGPSGEGGPFLLGGIGSSPKGAPTFPFGLGPAQAEIRQGPVVEGREVAALSLTLGPADEQVVEDGAKDGEHGDGPFEE